jgi:hypothetical protein
VKHFRHMLEARHFLIFTHHKPFPGYRHLSIVVYVGGSHRSLFLKYIVQEKCVKSLLWTVSRGDNTMCKAVRNLNIHLCIFL